MTESRFKQWLLLVCKDYLTSIRDGRKGDLRRRSLHILLGQVSWLNPEDIDNILWNLDREIGLEVDKLGDSKNLELYAKTLFDRIMKEYFGIIKGHKYTINNPFPR